MSNREATITAFFALVFIIIGLTSYICEAEQKIATQSELIDVLLETPEEEWEPILKAQRSDFRRFDSESY
jgi:hypothetical protein